MVGARSKNSNLRLKLRQFGRIGILAGGPSSEREISLRSGRAVYEALKQAGGDVLFLDVCDRLEDEIRDSKFDVVFIALHGRFGEDGTVQRMLGRLGIPYTGSGPEASLAALDKIASRREFEKAGIPIPKYRIIEKDIREFSNLNFPLVVKPQLEGSSIGLSVVDEEGQLAAAMKKAFQYGSRAIAEEFIKGKEITVGILGEEALPPVEILPAGRCYDFFAKYESPDTQYLVPAPLKRAHSEKAKRLGLLAQTSLGCRSLARVDMILGDDGNFYVLEVNSIPGLTERSLLPKAAQAAGVSFQDLCIKVLHEAFKQKGREKNGKRKEKNNIKKAR